MKRALTLVTAALLALAAPFAQAAPSVRTLADMVAAGRISRVSRSITEKNFPVKPERFTTEGVDLVHYDHLMSTKDVLADLDRRGFRPATIEELLAYAEQSWHGEDWVFALGSSWIGAVDARRHSFFPYLYEDDGVRGISLEWDLPVHRWGPSDRFLAVRKPVASAAPAVRTLADMIAAGHYVYADPDITPERFRVNPKRFTSAKVESVPFDRYDNHKAALAELDRRGLRPATTEEFLAYGAEKPEEQRRHTIISLGSVWRGEGGRIFLLVLDEDSGERRLNLYYGDPGGGWYWPFRVLAVRK